MSERCFCHLNGLAVKDATARRELENKVSHDQLTQSTNNLNNSIQNVVFRQTETERQISGVQSAVEELNNVVNNLDVPDAEHIGFNGAESGLESENVQDAFAEVMEKLAKAGTVRYVNDVADENYDWVQVQDAEGNWVNYQKGNLDMCWFIENGVNKGNLSVVSGGSITSEDGFTVLSGSGQSASAPLNAQYSFDGVNLTNYSKITIKQTTTFPGTNSTITNNSIVVSVTDTSGNTLTTTSTGIVNNSKVNSEDIVLDISNINEVGILNIRINYYEWTSDNKPYSFTCKLSQVYAE